MSRTTFKVSMKTKSVDEVLQIIERTLKPVGYNEKIIDGEYVWAFLKKCSVLLQFFQKIQYLFKDGPRVPFWEK